MDFCNEKELSHLWLYLSAVDKQTIKVFSLFYWHLCLLLESGPMALVVFYPSGPCRAHEALGVRLGSSLFLTSLVE